MSSTVTEYGNDVVVITNPNIWLTNIYQGNGHMVEVVGEYRVKRSDIMTDDSAPGYSADSVHGLVYAAMNADVKIEREAKVA